MPSAPLALRDASFPMAHCAHCDKSVLTYVTLDDDGGEHRVCVHCDNQVGEALAWVGPGELEQSGYYFGAPPEESAKGGCSSGCGSCAVKKS
jgi:hypothetical protein